MASGTSVPGGLGATMGGLTQQMAEQLNKCYAPAQPVQQPPSEPTTNGDGQQFE